MTVAKTYPSGEPKKFGELALPIACAVAIVAIVLVPMLVMDEDDAVYGIALLFARLISIFVLPMSVVLLLIFAASRMIGLQLYQKHPLISLIKLMLLLVASLMVLGLSVMFG